MRITIEPTEDQSGRSTPTSHISVVVKHPSDDLDIYEVANLIAGALVAYGYHESNVRGVIQTSFDYCADGGAGSNHE